MEEKYIVNIDWFEMYCHVAVEGESLHLPTGASNWQFRTEAVSSRIYSYITYVSHIDESANRRSLRPFCEILHHPRSPILHPCSASLKVANLRLYEADWFELLRALCFAANIRYRNVTRVDVCADFNTFRGGRSPERLLQKYLTQKVLKIGKDTFSVYGRNKVIDKDGYAKPPQIDSVTWGKIESGRQHSIYNKSLELRQVKFKPWIYDTWKRAGLNPEEVWRAEIRIKDKGKTMQLIDGGLFSLGAHRVSSQDTIEELWWAYADKCFDFRRRDGHTRVYNMPRIKLWSAHPAPSVVPKFHHAAVSSLRGFDTLIAYCRDLERITEQGLIDRIARREDTIGSLRHVIGTLCMLRGNVERRKNNRIGITLRKWAERELHRLDERDVFKISILSEMAERGVLEDATV